MKAIVRFYVFKKSASTFTYICFRDCHLRRISLYITEDSRISDTNLGLTDRQTDEQNKNALLYS